MRCSYSDEPGARAPVSVARVEPPADGVYHVRRGDTISRISARFGLTEASLVAMNGLRNRHQIAVGQRLMVSTSASAHQPTPKIEQKVAAAAATLAKPVEQTATATITGLTATTSDIWLTVLKPNPTDEKKPAEKK